MATVGAGRRTQQERSRSSISQLVSAARELFGSNGYAATSLDDVLAAAGLSKGGLYHHFAGKPELFSAVFEREQRLLSARVIQASRRHRDPWDAFFAGCRAFLEGSLDPEVRRITLYDAPAVLGRQRMRELEAPHSFGFLESELRAAVDDGRLPGRDPVALAHIVFGAMCEGVGIAADGERAQATVRQLLTELRRMLVSHD